ncbi:MAG: VOC family protein [Thermoanaerobaculia bacterium]
MPNDTNSTEAQPFQAVSLAASLTVNDLQKSLAWYCDVLGFSIERKHEREGTLRAVSLLAGNVAILIGQDDGAKGLNREKGTGFSMRITTAQDIDGIASRIKANGGVLESEPFDTPWGTRAFRVVDPDGFKYLISS